MTILYSYNFPSSNEEKYGHILQIKFQKERIKLESHNDLRWQSSQDSGIEIISQLSRQMRRSHVSESRMRLFSFLPFFQATGSGARSVDFEKKCGSSPSWDGSTESTYYLAGGAFGFCLYMVKKKHSECLIILGASSSRRTPSS